MYRFLQYLKDRMSTVLVAVVLAPVLPDVFVDVAGDWRGEDPPGWWRPSLRGLAIVAVVLVAVVVDRLLRWHTRRQHEQGGLELHGASRADVLVLAFAKTPQYRRRDRRKGERSLAERLVDTVKPSVAVAVCSPQNREQVESFRGELAADGVTQLEIVLLSDFFDPETTLAECRHRIAPAVRRVRPAGASVTVDLTGGSSSVTIGLLTVATLVGGKCLVVGAEYGKDNKPIDDTQAAREFVPVRLVAS